MTEPKARKFEIKPAVREALPLIVSFVGESSSGKTYSALRVASGIRAVMGGDICVIDTEARRALHYADMFQFQHLDMKSPFSPLDYLAAVECATKSGAKTIVIDSLSHEHEGPGGVLEWHEAELTRLAGADYKKRDKMNFTAWIKPKSARQRLINTLLQLGVSLVLCFRAKEKIELTKGGKPVQMGWMPIGGSEWKFQATVQFLLYPNSGGVPTLESEKLGEQQIIKIPKQFEQLLQQHRGPVDESIGEYMAAFVEGFDVPASRPAAPASPSSKAISQAQASLLFTRMGERAKAIGVKPADVEAWLREGLPKLGVDSIKKIPASRFESLLARIDRVEEADIADVATQPEPKQASLGE